MQNTVKQWSSRFNWQVSTFQKIVEKYADKKSFSNILVYGCGSGAEAVTLQYMTGARVFGVDLHRDFHPVAAQQAALATYDGAHLPFADDSFDLVYSYHVLEHVQNVQQSLAEIKRVLKPNGTVYIGTPNKSRLFGYFGMRDKSLQQKMRANVRDWHKRLHGKWENELGAHAGFYPKNLKNMLADMFGQAAIVTDDYYFFKWPNRQNMLRVARQFGLDRFIYPSVYVIAGEV